MYVHRHEVHNLAYRNTQKFCELCHEPYKTKREHNKVCKCKRHGFNFKWTDEEKKHISEKRKQFLKENPDKHPWKNKEKFISKPCEHLKTILKEKGFDFVEEYTDDRWEHSYSLDIAFLDKKIAIEVNGNQHYNNDGSLKNYYQIRHDYLTSQGWCVFEIRYNWCYIEDKINELITSSQWS